MSAPTVPPTLWLRVIPRDAEGRAGHWRPLAAETMEDALWEARPIVRAADAVESLPVAGQLAIRRGTSLFVQFIVTPFGHALPTGQKLDGRTPFQVPA